MTYQSHHKCKKFITSLVMLLACVGISTVAFSDNPFSAHSSYIMTHEEFNSWAQDQIATGNSSLENDSIHEVSLTPAVDTVDRQPLEITVTRRDYLLGPGDRLDITVSPDDKLSLKNFKIGVDGMVSMPLIGDIEASGKSRTELTNDLETLLREFLIEPRVDIAIVEQKPTVAYIVGAVKRPGSHLQMAKESNVPEARDVIVNEDYHLTTALANAGGALENADLSHVHVFNKARKRHQILNLMNLLAFGQIDQDIDILPDDVVYVPTIGSDQQVALDQLKLVARSNIGQHQFSVRIYGMVKEPNVYTMNPEDMTLQALLARAGGPEAEADRSLITIARANADGSLSKVVVDSRNTEVMLRPNDIVMVDETRKVLKFNQMIGLIARVLTPPLQGSFILRNIDQVWGIGNR